MIGIKKSKQILESGGMVLTKEGVKLIREFLYQMAELNYQQLNCIKDENEN